MQYMCYMRYSQYNVTKRVLDIWGEIWYDEKKNRRS